MKARDILLALVPPICWGAGFTIAKPAITQFPPLMMMLLVYGAIAVILALTVRSAIRTPWGALSLIAAFGITIQGAFIFIALQGLTASVASLVIQIQVPCAVVLGWIIGGDAFSMRKLIGTIVATLGVVLVIGLPEEKPPLVPVLLMVAGAFFWAVGQVLARKLGRDEGIVQLKGLAFAGLPQLLVATLLLESGQWQAVATATAMDWLALAFVAGVGFYLAYASWYSLLRRHSVDTIAPFVLLMPVVGIFTAALLLGEQVTTAHLIGGAVIIIGLVIVTVSPRLKSEAALT
jgi:O-acetylserine/cysteine efflux transporter